MKRVFIGTVIGITLGLCLMMPALARNAGLRDHMIELARGHAQKLGDLEAEMKAQTSDQWSEVDVQDYLAEALSTVYFSTWACRFGDSVLPNSPKDLEGGQYCPKWPLNPFNNWEAMKVLAATDPFSPGDLTYQICPPDFYSFMDDTLKPLSYELGIYAPSIEFSRMGNAKPLELNTWATTPDGTMYMTGSFTETAEMTAKKLERRIAKKKAAEEEAAKQSSDSTEKPKQEEKN
jgi:hypothetical protein